MHAQSCPALWDSTDCSPPGTLSVGFPRQESWSELPFPSPENLPDPGIKAGSPALAGRFFPAESPRKPVLHSSIWKWSLCFQKTPQQ